MEITWFKKIAYQRLYFHPPSFVYMKDIFYVRRKEVFSCLTKELKEAEFDDFQKKLKEKKQEWKNRQEEDA